MRDSCRLFSLEKSMLDFLLRENLIRRLCIINFGGNGMRNLIVAFFVAFALILSGLNVTRVNAADTKAVKTEDTAKKENKAEKDKKSTKEVKTEKKEKKSNKEVRTDKKDEKADKEKKSDKEVKADKKNDKTDKSVNTKKETKSDDKVIGKDDKGRTIYEGPRGGHYYINANGNKTYVERDKK
jgi:colicin import membrane protein